MSWSCFYAAGSVLKARVLRNTVTVTGSAGKLLTKAWGLTDHTPSPRVCSFRTGRQDKACGDYESWSLSGGHGFHIYVTSTATLIRWSAQGFLGATNRNLSELGGRTW